MLVNWSIRSVHPPIKHINADQLVYQLCPSLFTSISIFSYLYHHISFPKVIVRSCTTSTTHKIHILQNTKSSSDYGRIRKLTPSTPNAPSQAPSAWKWPGSVFENWFRAFGACSELIFEYGLCVQFRTSAVLQYQLNRSQWVVLIIVIQWVVLLIQWVKKGTSMLSPIS
jgi:hypothetical protein